MTPSIFTVRLGVKNSLDAGANRPASSRFSRQLFESPRKRFPIRCGPETQENIDLIRIRADQHPRLAAFHAAQNPRRGCLWRSPKKLLKPGSLLLMSRSCNTGPDARAPRYLRSNPAGCTHDTHTLPPSSSWRSASVNPRTANLLAA